MGNDSDAEPTLFDQLQQAGRPLTTRAVVGATRATAGDARVTLFDPTIPGAGSPSNLEPRLVGLYFLSGRDRPPEVVRYWSQVNRESLLECSADAIGTGIEAYGDAFQQAWQAHSRQFFEGSLL